jgi:ribosomal small subunit protein bTHX
LTSADIEGPYYTRALIIVGRAKVEYVCLNLPIWSSNLGKGDKRTFRGKVFKGSHGKTRPRKPKKKAKKPA